MVPEYRKSFFSVEMTSQLRMKNFNEGDEIRKAEIFGCHPVHWKPIREKVKKWAQSGWERWEDEQPEWFTDQWKARLPDDMKPRRRRKATIKGRKGGSKPVETEEDKNDGRTGDSTEGGQGQGQGGRRKSLIENLVIKLESRDAKISPAGNEENEEEKVDFEEFKSAFKRRGSIEF